jgi:hypothetical protein
MQFREHGAQPERRLLLVSRVPVVLWGIGGLAHDRGCRWTGFMRIRRENWLAASMTPRRTADDSHEGRMRCEKALEVSADIVGPHRRVGTCLSRDRLFAQEQQTSESPRSSCHALNHGTPSSSLGRRRRQLDRIRPPDGCPAPPSLCDTGGLVVLLVLCPYTVSRTVQSYPIS